MIDKKHLTWAYHEAWAHGGMTWCPARTILDPLS